MDARAGEANQAGLDIKLISGGLTHTNVTSTERYIRSRVKKLVTAAEARKTVRVAGDGEGGSNGG